MKRLRAFLIGFILFAANIVAQFQSNPSTIQNFDKYNIDNQETVCTKAQQLACVEYEHECK